MPCDPPTDLTYAMKYDNELFIHIMIHVTIIIMSLTIWKLKNLY